MSKKNTYLYVLSLTAMLAVSNYCVGQITSSTANTVKPLTYKTHPAVDKLFVFYQSNESFRPGSLTATAPSAGSFDFIWMKYDGDSNDFTVPFKSESGVLNSTIGNLDEGGYRVQISNGADIDTSFVGWVMLNNFEVSTVKDELGQVPYVESACPPDLNWIRVAGSVKLDDSFYYFDLATHDTLRIENDFDVKWTSDNPDLIIPNSTNKNTIGGNYSENPPFIDTWYILTATDSLGMTEVDSVFYDTKFTKAEFSVEYYDKITREWTPDMTIEWNKEKGSLDAPLQVSFINESENGYKFTWVFLDTTNELTGESTFESEESFDKDYSPEFTYYTADKYYYPYLISISDENCVDTFFLEDGIQVVPAQLVIPNVFTPNGDGTNDYFVFKHQSIREFKITISDRFGRVVYREKIDDIYEWEGWKGTVLNSEREAPEGQYYYVIEGFGYDNQEFKDLNYIERILQERKTGTGTTTPGQGNEDEKPSSNLYTGWLYIFRGKGEY